MPYMYFMGQIVEETKAKISIAANSLQYGITCFAGIRGYASDGKVKVFRLEDHYIRLMQGAKIVGIDYSMPYEVFRSIIAEMIAKNKPESEFYIRPFIFCPQARLGPRPAGLTFDLAIYMLPFSGYFDPCKGLKLMISSWRKFSDTSLSTKAKAGGCYLNSFLATGEAQRLGFDEALIMDHEGFIVEASVANVLIVRRGEILAPETGQALLEGITLRTAVELLQEEGKKVNFERIDRSMIYTSEELMMLGTAANITFAASVDDRAIGDGEHAGEVCKLLRKKFQSVISGTHPKSKQWLDEF